MSEREQVCHKHAFPGPEDPPPDWSREEAAFERERHRLVRDHLGKFVVVYQDEVFGPFDTLGEALMGGYSRFGDVPMIYKQIWANGPADFVSLVDVNHPSIRQID